MTRALFVSADEQLRVILEMAYGGWRQGKGTSSKIKSKGRPFGSIEDIPPWLIDAIFARAPFSAGAVALQKITFRGFA